MLDAVMTPTHTHMPHGEAGKLEHLHKDLQHSDHTIYGWVPCEILIWKIFTNSQIILKKVLLLTISFHLNL